MKILFVSDRNLTHDIRLFNEIEFANSIGYKADLLAIYDSWAEEIEKVHIKLVNLRHYKYLKSSFKTKFLYKYNDFLSMISRRNYIRAGLSLDEESDIIWQSLKKIEPNYDLIIAHGINSLVPVSMYSERYGIPFAFDNASFILEQDAFIYDLGVFNKYKLVYKNVIPKAFYVSHSSDLIKMKMKNFLDKHDSDNHIVVYNSYPEHFFAYRPTISDKVEFVWLAKKVDLIPDLEMVLPSLERFREKIRLNIFGPVTAHFSNKVYPLYEDFLVIHEPLPVDVLLKKIAFYDIGLAVYLTYLSPEKNYTITNKVFAYAQNGLFTLASDTVSNRIFYSENKILGQIVLPNIDSLIKAIDNIIQNIDKIRAEKEERFKYSKKFAWKYESQKIKKEWDKVIGKDEKNS